MDRSSGSAARIVEEEIELTAAELCRACGSSVQQVEVWVFEGVLAPRGASRAEWRFGGEALGRLRLAMRLARDLELNEPGVALAIELIERIESLEARLRTGT